MNAHSGHEAPVIHELSDVKSKTVGARTRVWQFCVIMDGAQIGDDCNICSHCLIESGVTIGNRVTVKSGVQIWEGARIEDDVFIGPNVTFTNDSFPRSKQYPDEFERIHIEHGASIGANSTILPGVRIGASALIGAGSVITKDIPAGVIAYGNPAKVRRKID